MFKINRHRKIRNYLIFPKFQLTLVGINLLIMTFFYVMVYYQINNSFQNLIDIGKRLRLPENSAFFNLLNHHQSAIETKLFIAALISYLFCFVLTVIISHKVSGPIYRLKKYFIDMKAKGYTQQLQFRKGDYYSELPAIVNEGLASLKDQSQK